MKSTINILCALALLTAALLPARAASPEYLNYQGLLNGADGQPLPTGSYTMEFNIYDQANAGTKRWGPFLFDGGAGNGHGPQVPVVNGRFNVIIGPRDITAASITNAFATVNRFVEIKVNNGAPILPRQQFLSTPYAFKANTADQAAQATVAASVSDVNIAYRNTANIFTGNQTVTGNITASGNITAGGKSVVVGEENLRMVRGEIGGGSTSQTNPNWPPGRGISNVERLAKGRYKVSFSPAFTAPPTVTANQWSGGGDVGQVGNKWADIEEMTSSHFIVGLREDAADGSGPYQDGPFTFIAIGRR